FGRPIADHGVTRQRIADARIMIDGARYMVLSAAWKMDIAGNKAARKEIAMIKVHAPNVACQVIDWAIQAHGGAGGSEDLWPCPCLCACPCPSACRWPRRSASKPDREARDRRANVRSHRVVERGWLKWRRESRWMTSRRWTAGACSSAARRPSSDCRSCSSSATMRQDFNPAFRRAAMRTRLLLRRGGGNRLALADEVIE